MDEFAWKVAKVRTWLEAADKEAAVFSRRENYRWLGCGVDDTVDREDGLAPADIVVTREKVFLGVPSNESARHLAEDGWSARAEALVYPWWENRFTCLDRMLKSERTVADGPGTPFPDAGRSLARLRYELHEQEIERYRLLGRRTARVHERVLGDYAAGIPEEEAAARLGGALAADGLRPVVMLVGADERLERYPHPLPTPGRFRERLMVCTCVEKWGLIVSSTYFLVTGAGYRRWGEKHRQITDCLARMVEATRPGLGVGEFVRLVREFRPGSGVSPDWEAHHQGGATGYRTRDYLAWSDSAETFQPRQAFAWNPYGGGVKQEATFVAGAGPEEGPLLVGSPESWPACPAQIGGKEYPFPNLGRV